MKRGMTMDAEIKNAVNITDADAQYDEKAKRLLGNKIILAHILVKTVDEFRGMHPKDVVSYIEGEPFISVVPVEPGLTNVEKEVNGQRIVGMNTENLEINEGLIRFDIIFYVWMTDGISQVIVNLEAQKDEPTGYHILNRAVFYVSRLVSSQKERDFVGINFNDIKRVFSIWICMNMDENSMAYVHLAKDDLLGNRKDVECMCNLGQGIFEKGEIKGEAKMILRMYQKGYTIEQIMDISEKSLEEIKAVIEQKEAALV